MGFDQIYIAVKMGILRQSGASSAGALGFFRMYAFHIRVAQVQRELALHRRTNPDFTPTQHPARLPILPRLNGGINVTRHIYLLCELFCNAPLCLGEGGGEGVLEVQCSISPGNLDWAWSDVADFFGRSHWSTLTKTLWRENPRCSLMI
jgi:hypothetical protein